jgi:hypothetical protein
MRIFCTLALFCALAAADPTRIRYRDGGLDAALAEAKSGGRLVLVVLAMDG